MCGAKGGLQARAEEAFPFLFDRPKVRIEHRRNLVVGEVRASESLPEPIRLGSEPKTLPAEAPGKGWRIRRPQRGVTSDCHIKHSTALRQNTDRTGFRPPSPGCGHGYLALPMGVSLMIFSISCSVSSPR